MKIPIYQIDAFASDLFLGNPASVCLLENWPDDQRLQNIAAENNHSETAFLVRNSDGFDIRWFTPATEVSLCGHATLASSFVIFNRLNWPQDIIRFQTRQSGVLFVGRNGKLLEMDFPARPPSRREIPPGLAAALSHSLLEAFSSEEDLLVTLEDESAVRGLLPNFNLLEQVQQRGIIVTAPGESCDFVSRFFAPGVGITEDPVTGSAHCVLVPFWARRLGRNQLHARQLSKRGGELFCEDRGPRITIAGQAVLYLEGTITI
jgi:predicted PhzF superfamily epimerase YddE/YHI9